MRLDRRSLEDVFLVALLACVPSTLRAQPGKRDAKMEADPSRVCLVLTGGATRVASHLELADSAQGQPLEFRNLGQNSVTCLPVGRLASDGSLTLKQRPAGRSEPEGAPGGIYLAPAWPESTLHNRDFGWLRVNALAAREFPKGVITDPIVLDRAVPIDAEFGTDGKLRSLTALGTNMLSSKPAVEPLVWCGEKPAEFLKHQSQGESRSAAWYRDPSQPENLLKLEMEKLQDRLRISMSYEVNQPADRDVPVHLRLPLAKPVDHLWGVAWRFTRSAKGGTGELRFDPKKPSQSLYTFMAQVPLALARMADGSYVGVLDYDLDNLVVEARRTPGKPDTLYVSTYLWPREKGRRYNWTFELLAGYENLFNAALRATWPYTKNNTELFQGVLAREVYNEFPTLDEPLKKGVRAMWYHRWFRRNGAYFDPSWPMDRPYPTPFSYFQSYDLVKGNVARLHKSGLQVFMYCQFAGISADLLPKYKDWVVRDENGDPIRAGQDGVLYNLWANPDPAGEYGKSVLQQIGGLLDAVGADGIALDRADRFDWTYGPDQFDYGHFNGYSSVFPHDGRRRPVASITVAGKAWLNELRKLLDSKGKKLVINSGAHMYPINLADSNMMEITADPVALVLGKIFGNGRSTAYTVHGRLNDSFNNYIAELTQAYPYHRDRLQAGIYLDDMAAPVNFTPGKRRGRLLYAISEDGRWPTLWYFDNGYTKLDYNPRERTLLLRFRGSKFVPR